MLGNRVDGIAGTNRGLKMMRSEARAYQRSNRFLTGGRDVKKRWKATTAAKSERKVHFMDDKDKTKEELLSELQELRSQLAKQKQRVDKVDVNSVRQYRQLFYDMPDPVFVIDDKGMMQEVNPAGLKMLGCGPTHVRQIKYTDLFVDATDKERILKEMSQYQSVRNFSCRIRSIDGREFDVLVTASERRNADGRVIGFQGVLRDITEFKLSEKRRQETADELEFTVRQLEDVIEKANLMAVEAEVISAELNIIFNASSDGICVLDNDKKIIRINDAFAKMTGANKMEAEGLFCHDLFSESMCGDKFCLFEQVQTTGKSMEVEINYERPGGEPRTYIMTGTPLLGFAGELAGVVESYKDITQRKSMERELKRMATFDELTGAYNRAYFLGSAKKDFSRFHRYGFPLSFIGFDLDHFKKINDTYGHAAGDKVLSQVGMLARQNIRDSDILGRLGGEEFGVILVESTLEDAKTVAHRIRESFLEAGVQLKEQQIKYTASFGVAELEEGEDLEGLMARADNALYLAKNSGRNQVRLAS